MRFECVDAGVGAAGEAGGFGAKFSDARHDALAAAGDTLAIHVAGKSNVAKLGQTSGLLFGVLVESGASVNDENSGSLFRLDVVPNEDSRKVYMTILISS